MWNGPDKGGAQADIVLTAPQDDVPLLFIEVDNCHETAKEIADKLEKYARFFRRKMQDTDGKERPMWRTRWTFPAGRPPDPRGASLLTSYVACHSNFGDTNSRWPRSPSACSGGISASRRGWRSGLRAARTRPGGRSHGRCR
ncbi:replication-relaxation family protein [Streptomyces sp. NPDC059970]|uniref:replication-relaxation family protein n=1 Tax=Streptomyces sp. NPDC059970 TaxID=3347019 RepID=UPI003675BEC9